MLSYIRFALVMVSLHSNRTVSKKLVPRTGVLCDRPGHAVCLEEYGRFWTRKVVERFQQGLMGHSNRSVGYSSGESCANCNS